ncbi:MAG: tetratricopeptide repeat protein [Thermoplasmatota archaeon]
MTSDLQERVAELFEDFDMKLELEQVEEQIPEEIKEIMEEVKKFDSSYNLKLEEPRYYIEFSIVALAEDDPYEAEEWAKKALKLKKNCESLVALGNALYKQGDYKGALGEYDEALNYCSKKGKVHEYRYRALKKRGMDERALDALEEAIKETENEELLADYADTLVDIGNIEKAKKFYDVVEEKTGLNDRRDKKIGSLLEKARAQSLPSEFDKIIELDDSRKEAWLGKADKYWNMGQKQKAIDCLKDSREYLVKGAVDKELDEYEDDIPILKECPDCGGSGDCPTCDGTGNCYECDGSGDCVECSGSGSCSTCGGTAECPDCEGSGKSGWFKKCETCGGTGICQDCNEFGTCLECDGTGDCQVCDGNGNCGDCNGSGTCTRCEGTGMIKE